MEWDSYEIKVLSREWRNRSAREIGEMLGRTKNSVIGKANRIGLKKIPETEKIKRSVTRKQANLRREKTAKSLVTSLGVKDTTHTKSLVENKPIKTRKEVKEIASTCYGGVVDLIDLKENQCRWPVDTQNGVKFCGCKVKKGYVVGQTMNGAQIETRRKHVYCEKHYRISVRKRPLNKP